MSWRFTRFRVAEHQVELRQGWIFRQQRQVPPRSRPGRRDLPTARGPDPGTGQGRRCNRPEARTPTSPSLTCRSRGRTTCDRIQRAASRLEGGAAGRPTRGAPTGGCSPPRGTEGPYGSLPGDLLGLAPTPGAWSCRCPTCGSCWPASATREWSSSSWPGSRHRGTPPSSRTSGALRRIVVALPGLVPMLFGLLPRVREVLKHGNFRLTDQGRSVRILRPHRPSHDDGAAAAGPGPEIVQPMMWRPMGWWRARVNAAGIHGDDSDLTNETVPCPSAPWTRPLTVPPPPSTRPCRRGPPAHSGPGRRGRGQLGDGIASRAALRSAVGRRSGYTMSGHESWCGRGCYQSPRCRAPRARPAIALLQGPWDARRDPAAVSLGEHARTDRHRHPHLSPHDAEAFLDEESQRTSAARRSEGTPCANPAPGDGLSSVDIAPTDGHRP